MPALLIALVLLAVLRSNMGTKLDSFTIDEPWHIVAGASYLRTGDWRLNPEHPPLTKLWVGAFMPASLLAIGPLEPLIDKVQEREFVERTVYLDNDALAVQQRARLAMWAFNGLLLFLLGLLAWRIFGPVVASDWRWRSALLTGLTIGLALGTKHSALAGLATLGLGLVLVVIWQARISPMRQPFRE